MTNTETDEKLKAAFTHAVPDTLNLILSDCEKQKGNIFKMTDIKKRNFFPRRLAAVAAAFVLLLGGVAGFQFYQSNFMVASTVSLDVNPSIEILVNKNERVIEVNARNQDAQIVIGDMDFKGSSLDITLNALIGSMLRNGYLNELANSILVSVDNQDPIKSAELQARLADEINALLKDNSFNGAVLSQTISTDSHLQELADSYGITLGKAQLIQQIITQNTFYSFADLVSLSINELNLLSESGNLNLDNINSLGTASDKAYIGEGSAWNTAFSHAGVSEANDIITHRQIEMDYENGIMVYELEFKCQGYEYDYDIDAVSGIILKQNKERDDDASIQAPAEAQTPATDAGQAAEPLPPATEPQDPASGAEQPAEAQPDYTVTPGHHNWGGHHGDMHHSEGYCVGTTYAKSIACSHAGLSEASIYDYECELDDEDGVMIYEIKFKCDGYEYEYDIDALTGSILKNEKSYDD